MELARRTYTTWARPFRDSDQMVQIRWYRVPREWGTLPFPSAMNSLDWYAEPLLKTGVGEVPFAPRRFVFSGPPAGGPFGHICGTREDHARGGRYLPDEPAVLYAANGLPVCCQERPDIPAAGGIEVGGAADISADLGPATVYGIDLGGHAEVTSSQTVGSGSGGIDLGGAAEVSGWQPAGMGTGIDLGGAAEISSTAAFDPADTYFFTDPVSGDPVVMFRQEFAALWIATAPDDSNLSTSGPSEFFWGLYVESIDAGFQTAPWDGQGSRVFSGPSGSITVTAGLPTP